MISTIRESVTQAVGNSINYLSKNRGKVAIAAASAVAIAAIGAGIYQNSDEIAISLGLKEPPVEPTAFEKFTNGVGVVAKAILDTLMYQLDEYNKANDPFNPLYCLTLDGHVNPYC